MKKAVKEILVAIIVVASGEMYGISNPDENPN